MNLTRVSRFEVSALFSLAFVQDGSKKKIRKTYTCVEAKGRLVDTKAGELDQLREPDRERRHADFGVKPRGCNRCSAVVGNIIRQQ